MRCSRARGGHHGGQYSRVSGGNILSPAQLLFNCGAGDDAGGGGDFRLHYRPEGSLNYVTDGLLAVNTAFYGTVNTPISVSAPGLLQDAVDVDGSGACALVSRRHMDPWR